MEIATIKQLDEWMTANCYTDSYGIGDRNIHEGYGLSKFGSLYVWYYTERGERDNLTYFQTEREAVDYAFKELSADKSASRHMIGFIKDKHNELELIAELRKRNIEFWKDEIPYGGPNDTRIRIFVFGCDVKKALDLQHKYNEHN